MYSRDYEFYIAVCYTLGQWTVELRNRPDTSAPFMRPVPSLPRLHLFAHYRKGRAGYSQLFGREHGGKNGLVHARAKYYKTNYLRDTTPEHTVSTTHASSVTKNRTL